MPGGGPPRKQHINSYYTSKALSYQRDTHTQTHHTHTPRTPMQTDLLINSYAARYINKRATDLLIKLPTVHYIVTRTTE